MQFSTPSGAIDTAHADLIVAGWTGRDRAGVQHHIDELAEIGVAPPSRVPLFYRVSRGLLCQDERIDVLGPDTSGEAEPLVVRSNGRTWLGLGSDHTDRALEVISVAASKQACPKPCAAALWPWESVADHLDRIRIRAWIEEDGDWTPYQEGTLTALRPLSELMEAAPMGEDAAMLCGTFPATGGVRPATRFRAAMDDPVSGAEISLCYDIRVLPVVT